MALRIPKNQIQYKYTIGKEYMYKNTYKEYQGHYYTINNKIFAGKEFNIGDPELVLIKPKEIKLLEENPSVKRYIKLAKNPPPLEETNNPATEIEPFYFNPSMEEMEKGETIRYFASKKNQTPIIIREISEDNYTALVNNPLYSTVKMKCYLIKDLLESIGNNNYIFDNKDIENAKKQIPEIEDFIHYVLVR